MEWEWSLIKILNFVLVGYWGDCRLGSLIILYVWNKIIMMMVLYDNLCNMNFFVVVGVMMIVYFLIF